MIRQPTTDKQQTTSNKRQTPDDGQYTTNDKRDSGQIRSDLQTFSVLVAQLTYNSDIIQPRLQTTNVQHRNPSHSEPSAGLLPPPCPRNDLCPPFGPSPSPSGGRKVLSPSPVVRLPADVACQGRHQVVKMAFPGLWEDLREF